MSDQLSREHIQKDLDRNLFVEAGAGTGKTTSLVGRLVELILSGVPVERIAAITFTRRAAAELRDRVRRRLEAHLADASHTGDSARLCREAISGLDSAAIETLHSFAQRILCWYPLEAGLPPRFAVRDDIQATVAFEDWWRRLLDDMLADPLLAEDWQAALEEGLKPGDLKEVARKFHANWDRLAEMDVRGSALPDAEWSAVEQAACQLRAGLSQCLSPDDKLLVEVRMLCQAWCSVATLAPEQRVSALRNLPKVNRRVGSAKAWACPVQDVKDHVKCFHDACACYIATVRMGVCAALVEHVRQAVLKAAGERRTAGQLEFADLLVLARDLLLQNEDVRQALHQRFHCLLIDEFQDTDPLQIQIAMLIAADARPPGDFNWRKAEARPGWLLFVGDPKQSIYRFRRADVTLYRQAQMMFSGSRESLKRNFRSREPLIDWVNGVFGEMIGSRNGDPCLYDSLECGRPDLTLQEPCVRLMGGPQTDLKAPEIRRLEAAAVAQTVLHAVGEAWTVLEKDGSSRAARLQDIAILMPSRSMFAALEEAFAEQRIPYRVESLSLLFAAREVRDLLNVLRAADDPSDPVAVVAALRGVAFSLSDQELLDYVTAGGKWDYYAPRPEQCKELPVVAAMDQLRDLNRRRQSETPAALLESVIRQAQLMEAASLMPRPRDIWQRERLFVDQARQFTESTDGSLRQFIRWCEAQEENQARVAETVVPEEDDDAVRILTIHASKGLEFPVVILCGLGASGGRAERARVVWDDDGRLALRIGASGADAIQTSGAADILKRNAELDDFEKDRLLYVAATRARCHLVVSVFFKQKKNERRENLASLASRLWQQCSNMPDLRYDPTGTAAPALPAQARIVDDEPFDEDAWVRARQDLISANTRVASLAATGVVRLGFPDVDDPSLAKEKTPSGGGESRGRGRGGTSLGRAVHAVLQTVDLRSGDGMEATARVQAEAEGLTAPADAARVVSLAKSALESAPVREAAGSGGDFWREVFVSAEVEGVLLHGFVDLLYRSPGGGLHVVDYKTDSVAGEASVQKLMERYRLQAASYALAIRESLGEQVADVWFVFAGETPARAERVSDLPAAMEDVRTLLRSNGAPAAPAG